MVEDVAVDQAVRPVATVAARLRTSWNEAMEFALAAAVAHASASEAERPALLKQVRKATKTGRALLRLLEGAMTPEARIGAERFLRDAASLLATVRDRDAMLTTIDGLLGGKLDARVDQAKSLLQSVLALPSVGDDQAAFEAALVRRAAALLSRASTLIQSVPDSEVREAQIGDAMASLWRKARRRAKRAWHAHDIANGTEVIDSEVTHDARKACSRLVHQLNLVEEDLDKPLRRFRQRLRRATSALGNEHDLALLAEQVALHEEHLGPTFTHAVLDVCRRNQARLREQAGVALAEAMTTRPRELSRRVRKLYAQPA
jgi:CHAD domain-containing protein